MNIIFKKVVGTDSQILSLFSLLKSRKYNISHKYMPSFEDHKKFVINNPYRVWYLFKKNNIDIGSFYIKFDNSIGVNLKEYTFENIKAIITFIKKEYVPNSSSPSLIPSYFYINSSSKNIELINLLNDLEKIPIQISYKI